jgi:hypothetical protein
MELTREMIESYKKSNNLFGPHIVHALVDQLLLEMDAPKVWTNAPDNAVRALTYFYDDKRSFINEKEYTRTLPKSRIDEIAEEAVRKYSVTSADQRPLVEIIKSAILHALEEKEAER